jgi:elongation factor G
MREYKSVDIRNMALVGHGASGKTMLSESMLAVSGVINRLGSVTGGTTVSDYNEDEHERKVSIHASLLHTEWKDKKFNILDAPGYADFVGEAIGALRVADLALVVVHARHGVEVGTEQMWRYADQNNLPKILILNACDKENFSFDEVLEELRERFGSRVVPMTLPINCGPGFNKVLDLLSKKFITYKTDGTGACEVSEPTGEWATKADEMHETLIEYVAESDDRLMEKFFEEGGLSEEEMKAGVHSSIQNKSFIPLFSVSGETNVGVASMMDFIAKYGPSPLDNAEVKGLNENAEEVPVKVTDNEPVAFVFKTVSEAHVGELSFFRIYSGSVSTGMTLHNSSRKKDERLGQLYLLNGKHREAATTLHAGDIGTVVKLKDTHTNNTLCCPIKKVSLSQIVYPNPSIHEAIKSKSKGDEEKLSIGLATMHEEDPTFISRVDNELHQIVISGQGELHLRVITKQLKRRFNIEILSSKPKVPYRETIKEIGEAKYRHRKQSGGSGQFAEVWLRVLPAEHDAGIEFGHSLVGQNVDRVFVPSVEKGVKVASTTGVLAGYKVVGTKVDFYDGKQHPVDSKDIAFQIAGKFAFREAFMAAKPSLLEPIMDVSVKVPEEFMGDVMGDISGRRGKILGMDTEGNFQIVKAQVPQAEMYHYSTHLRSITGGRGIHFEEFSHYENMPGDMEKKVIESTKLEQQET